MANASSSRKNKASAFLDAEFGGEHGTTLAASSVDDEKEPDVHPQNLREVGEKVNQEASDEPPVVGKVKKTLQEVDRQIGGEYEKREDRSAPRKIRGTTGSPAKRRGGGRPAAKRRPAVSKALRAAAGAEQEHSTAS